MTTMIVPGRILVIDDVPEQVSEMVDSLRLKGESVIFTTSMPEDEFLENVRLLIIDLYLVGNDKEASYDAVASILEKVSETTEFFIIALYSKYTGDAAKNKQIIEELKEIFHRRTETDLKAFFLEPFDKFSITQTELVNRLEKAIASNPICGLLLEIERSIENARDHTVSNIIVTASVPVILKALEEQVGEVALSREMVGLFLKVLGRHCKPTETMSVCIKELISQSPSIDADKYGRIHNLQSYYIIPEQEAIWTGDVLERKNGKEDYAVIVTPECDFAQRKKRPLDYMKLISGVRINHDDFANEELLEKIKTQLKISKRRTLEDCVKSILTGGLKKRFYVLKCLKDDQDTIFHLVLDFQRISKLRFKEKVGALGVGNWRRVCRIDTPIIADLLQKYSAYSSRIGVQTIPSDVVKSMIEKTKES